MKAINVDLAVGELRKSQALTVFGPGAIVDFPKFHGIIAGIDEWRIGEDGGEEKGFKKIRETNLEAEFAVKYFVEPCCNESEKNKYFLAAYRFPEWYYCPECHALGRFSEIGYVTKNSLDGNQIGSSYCVLCKEKGKRIELVPSRFIISCINGHLEDFPYYWWVHRHHLHDSSSPSNLTLEYTAKTGGLDSIRIRCTCGASETMANCTNKDAFKDYSSGCKRHMPWLGKDRGVDGKPWIKTWHKDDYSDSCEATVRCLQRSASNVYYPVLSTALTIPPFSKKAYELVDKAYENWFSDFLEDKCENDETEIETFNRLLKKNADVISKKFEKKIGAFKGGMEYFCELMQEVIKNRNGVHENDRDEKTIEMNLKLNEYKTFCGEDVNDEKLRTEDEPIPSKFSEYFAKVTKVKKLREVSVLRGFTRILPFGVEEEEDNKGKYNRLFTPITRQKKDWLPGMELYGEGIFLQLNPSKVTAWENSMFRMARYQSLAVRRKEKGDYLGGGMFDEAHPRYILLHTLSHLLIRSLSAECGYATASLKERIYSTFVGSEKDMCGILIYTSVSDSDGSLGGLVRQGQTDRMNKILSRMFYDATWCSNDPLCIEAESQGIFGMNYAACHACALLPETSCENFNCLLDRAAVVGKPGNKQISYFSGLLGEV